MKFIVALSTSARLHLTEKNDHLNLSQNSDPNEQVILLSCMLKAAYSNGEVPLSVFINPLAA